MHLCHYHVIVCSLILFSDGGCSTLFQTASSLLLLPGQWHYLSSYLVQWWLLSTILFSKQLFHLCHYRVIVISWPLTLFTDVYSNHLMRTSFKSVIPFCMLLKWCKDFIKCRFLSLLAVWKRCVWGNLGNSRAVITEQEHYFFSWHMHWIEGNLYQSRN